MSQINTKFNVGDTVWFIDNYDQLLSLKIHEITIKISNKVCSILYLNKQGYGIFENKVYSSKDECKELLIEKIKKM